MIPRAFRTAPRDGRDLLRGSVRLPRPAIQRAGGGPRRGVRSPLGRRQPNSNSDRSTHFASSRPVFRASGSSHGLTATRRAGARIRVRLLGQNAMKDVGRLQDLSQITGLQRTDIVRCLLHAFDLRILQLLELAHHVALSHPGRLLSGGCGDQSGVDRLVLESGLCRPLSSVLSPLSESRGEEVRACWDSPQPPTERAIFHLAHPSLRKALLLNFLGARCPLPHFPDDCPS
jgi:hypothetical protein